MGVPVRVLYNLFFYFFFKIFYSFLLSKERVKKKQDKYSYFENVGSEND